MRALYRKYSYSYLSENYCNIEFKMASSGAVILGESLRHRGRNGFKVGGAKHFFD